MNAHDLIAAARLLATHPRRGRPPEANLRRAVSTAYYALFHSLAECCADAIAGRRRANRSGNAWLRVYRALDHGTAKRRCNDQEEMKNFPPEIQNFAAWFSEMQRRRHIADYAPDADFDREETTQLITESENAIRRFDNLSTHHRHAFAVHILMPARRT